MIPVDAAVGLSKGHAGLRLLGLWASRSNRGAGDNCGVVDPVSSAVALVLNHSWNLRALEYRSHALKKCPKTHENDVVFNLYGDHGLKRERMAIAYTVECIMICKGALLQVLANLTLAVTAILQEGIA